jgi:drug/metabolite transporter (DMT)-like permease
MMHIATFLFGFTAVLGKLISLNEVNLVWYRMGIASLVFLTFPSLWQNIKKISFKNKLIFLGNGAIVAMHWLTFYGCIKLSNSSSLALACMGCAAAFTSILEPLFLKTKFQKRELALGIVVLIGLYFISIANEGESWTLESNYFVAFLVGIFSVFLAAIFSIVNKKFIQNHHSISVTWLQMTGGFISISLLLPYITKYYDYNFSISLSKEDWFYMLLLAIACTNLAFTLAISSLKQISAFVSNLIINLEPIYGFLLAFIIFKEAELTSPNFLIGASIITISVFVYPIIKKKNIL